MPSLTHSGRCTESSFYQAFPRLLPLPGTVLPPTHQPNFQELVLLILVSAYTSLHHLLQEAVPASQT